MFELLNEFTLGHGLVQGNKYFISDKLIAIVNSLQGLQIFNESLDDDARQTWSHQAVWSHLNQSFQSPYDLDVTLPVKELDLLGLVSLLREVATRIMILVEREASWIQVSVLDLFVKEAYQSVMGETQELT